MSSSSTGPAEVKVGEVELRTPDSGYSSVSSHGGSRLDPPSLPPSLPPFLPPALPIN